MNFANYDLAVLKGSPMGVFLLADGLIRRIANEISYHELGAVPTEEGIKGLIDDFGANKELQLNDAIERRLGPSGVNIAADWLEQSGALRDTRRSFASPGQEFPDYFDAVIWPDGVPRWMLRRLMTTLGLDPESVGRVLLPMGNGPLKPSQHPLVQTLERRLVNRVVAYEFGQEIIAPTLRLSGFPNVEVMEVKSSQGREVNRAPFRPDAYPGLLDGTILVIGNAPSVIQTAGQLRFAAREFNPSFDEGGRQLFMMSDTIPVARWGEGPDTHQDPFSGVVQLFRNYRALHKAVAA